MVILRSDSWFEQKGFQLEYQIDNCGGNIDKSTMIQSPEIMTSNLYQGNLQCLWNVTAPANHKIIVKFEDVMLAHTDYCSFDYVEVYNGTVKEDKTKLARVCGNLTNTIRPIVIENSQALIQFNTDQTNSYTKFSAAVYFMPRCDQKVILTQDKPTFVLDETDKYFNRSMECTYTFVGDTSSVIRVSFLDFHLPPCPPEVNQTCDCDYLEVHDGNGPFSEVIGRICGYQTPSVDLLSTRSAVYMRLVLSSSLANTGFKVKVSMIESPCGPTPFMKFYGNETTETYVTSPGSSGYPPNTRCLWTITAPYGKLFDIQFHKFHLEDSANCTKDFLVIEDKSVTDYVAEGLGEETIYRGASTQTHSPSFYTGISGPTAPHVYCGSLLPTDYISQSNAVNIKFTSDSQNQFPGFNFTIKVLSACSRNYTALQGRMVSDYEPEECKTTIKVPQNHTIALYFHRFFFYESDCTKSFLKIYDGDFENGVLLRTFCGYAMPDPIFSTKNQLSLFFHFGDSPRSIRGNYDIMYLATDKGRGCGGDIFNYGGIFSSPLFPSSNRTFYDCTWTVAVPSNLKVALRFASKFSLQKSTNSGNFI